MRYFAFSDAASPRNATSRVAKPARMEKNPAMGLKAAIPRHREIKTVLGRKICKELGIPVIEVK